MSRTGRGPSVLRTVPTIGVTVSDFFVAVSVRARPIRVTGVYRASLMAVEPSDRAAALRRIADAARRALRVSAGTPAVLALEPVASAVRLRLVDGWAQQSLPALADLDAVGALELAGFQTSRLDALPAALARFAAASAGHRGRIRTDRWVVEVTNQHLQADAHQSGGGDGPTTSGAGAGPGSPTGQPVALDRARIPAAVGRHLDPRLDAAAVGAALRGAAFDPDLMVVAVEDPPTPPLEQRWRR